MRASVANLARAVEARDAAAWKVLRLEFDDARNVRNISASLEVGRVGFSNDGSRALARCAVTVWGSVNGQSQILKRGLQDVGLARSGEGWSIPAPAWDVPESTMDALQALAETARVQWGTLHDAASVPAPGRAAQDEVQPLSGPRDNVVLHLVVERRGGRWIALRQYLWDGRVLSPQALARRESAPPAVAIRVNGTPAGAPNGAQGGAQNGSVQWIDGQLKRWGRVADGKGGGTLHLLLQNGVRDWVGLDGVWEPRLSQAPEALNPSAGPNAPGDESQAAPLSDEAQEQAPLLREEIFDDAIVFGDASAHKKLAQVLEGAGLFDEAADEWEKAALLVPEIKVPGAGVSAARLNGARARRAWDPLKRTKTQIHNETQIGVDANHPSVLLKALRPQQAARPTPLGALRIGLEYSKLGMDAEATWWLAQARQMINGGWRLSPDDQAWAEVLDEHLEQRVQLREIKPPNLLSTGIFTVRCRLDDLSVLPILAALEAAQHTVYADFGIPMGSTEVVLWPDQKAFQSYTTRFSSQGASEFVAALTLTKLIATSSGPMVLGEEVNVFVDPRLSDATFGTVAHEYGHVAVRQISRGRTVPVWFNEGLATVVEGGYDGAIERVRGAQRARRLLSMDAMRLWNVDGERAFLAYSQANSIVDFIAATWGPQKLLDILRQIGQDVPPEAAFSNALGLSTDQLWQRWARQGIR